MSWIFFALLAPLLYTLVTFIDKYILEKQIPDYNAMPIFTSSVAIIAGLIFFAATGFPILPIQDTLIILSTGIITSLSLIVYYKALSFEETSKINILFQMFPLITLLLSWLLLNQQLSLIEFMGFILILSATIGVSIERKKTGIVISKAFFLILLYDFMWASAGILMSFTISENSFFSVLPYESFGIGIGGVLIFVFLKNIRTAFLKRVKKIKRKALYPIALNETLFVIAKTTTFFAFSLGPVALVSVLEGTQAFFAILYGVILTISFPKVFHEGLKKEELAQKVVSAVTLFIGIVILSSDVK